MTKVHYSHAPCGYAGSGGRLKLETSDVTKITCKSCKSKLYVAERDSRYLHNKLRDTTR